MTASGPRAVTLPRAPETLSVGNSTPALRPGLSDNASVDVFSGAPPASITGPGGTVPVGDFEMSFDGCGMFPPTAGSARPATRRMPGSIRSPMRSLRWARLRCQRPWPRSARRGIRVLGLGPGAVPRPLGSGPINNPSARGTQQFSCLPSPA